jgi:hypothetical protein
MHACLLAGQGLPEHGRPAATLSPGPPCASARACARRYQSYSAFTEYSLYFINYHARRGTYDKAQSSFNPVIADRSLFNE